MKNILFIMPKLDGGGAERVLVNIINHLDRDIFNISLLLFNSGGLLIDNLRDDIEIYILNSKSTLRGLPLLLKKIYILKPDIIFSGIGNLNLYLSIFIPVVKLFLPKTIFIARQASILSVNNGREKSPRLYEWLYKRVYKNYSRVICQSLYMQRDLIENYSFPKDKSVVINNPIDIDSLERLSKEKIEYPFHNSIRLIHIGQLRYEKRQDLLLKALFKLDDRYSLTIIGDGAKREELESLASNLDISNRVAFLGDKKNPYSYLKEADIFLLTSEYEGFPNVLLEANLFGLPVVSFNSIGGISEIIKDKRNGILVAQGDIEAFATAIENIDIKNFNREKIIEDTKDKYNIDLIIEKYQKVFIKGFPNIIKDKL